MSTIKIVTLGYEGSGKSCLINKILYNKYSNLFEPTIGAQLIMKQKDENKLEIWDTSGQEKYRSFLSMYLHNGDIIFIIISIDKQNEMIEYEKEYWINFLIKNNTMSSYYKRILIYNKSDLNPNFVKDNDPRFDNICLVSCKMNENIDEFINIININCKEIKQRRLYYKRQNSSFLDINKIEKKKSNRCLLQ